MDFLAMNSYGLLLAMHGYEDVASDIHYLRTHFKLFPTSAVDGGRRYFPQTPISI